MAQYIIDIEQKQMVKLLELYKVVFEDKIKLKVIEIAEECNDPNCFCQNYDESLLTLKGDRPLGCCADEK